MAKLLLVDDNFESARLLARLLRHLGHDARIAHDGEAALDSLLDEVPDLIILDLMMPGIDGAEVLRRIRARSETRGVPVAIFSASDNSAVRDHLLASGAQDFWTKGSFDFRQLGRRVDLLLGGGVA